MTRTICDRCGKVIDRHEHVRTVTLFRPIIGRHDDDTRTGRPTGRPEPAPNDVVWQHDLCMECANKVEAFVETVGEDAPADADVGKTPGADEPDAGNEDA